MPHRNYTVQSKTDRDAAYPGIRHNTGHAACGMTGKTFTLQEVRRGIVVSGGTVIACAPTTSAAGVLRADGFTNATTLADLLKNAESLHGQKLHAATLIVDEAGIASARQGAELCDLVRRHGARLILVGDSRQHSGVEAGDFLSILERHSQLRTVELTDIRRQTAHEYRVAVKLMAQGQARAGVEAVDRLGWLNETGADYIQRAADHYVTSLAEKRNVILVAPTWEEINRLTEVVRTGLKKRGLLGHGETVSVAEPLSWTNAQAAKAANYRTGYLITLHGALPAAGLRAGETAEVVTVKRGRLLVRCAGGRETTVAPARQAEKWTVAAQRSIELAPGDRVLIRQNHRAAGLINGAVLTLESRQPSGAWRARDGAGVEKEIPVDFRAFTHGYAVTSHKSQGRTSDEVIVCAARLDAKSAYVAFSRARQRAAGYTPDKAALFAALPETQRPRQAALDLWTPTRGRRLRWARQVIARVREIFSLLTPRPERVAAAEPKVQNTPRIKPVVPKIPIEPSDHHYTLAIRPAEQPRMRISL